MCRLGSLGVTLSGVKTMSHIIGPINNLSPIWAKKVPVWNKTTSRILYCQQLLRLLGPIEKQCFHPMIQSGQIYDRIQDDHRFVTLNENISNPDWLIRELKAQPNITKLPWCEIILKATMVAEFPFLKLWTIWHVYNTRP